MSAASAQIRSAEVAYGKCENSQTNICHELWATKRKYLDFYDFLEWRRRWPRFLRGLMLFQTDKRDYFNFTAVSLTLSSVTATGNVFMKIRLHIFSLLSGSPRVIWGQTVNLPGVFLCNMAWNPKWHVTSVKWGLLFSWLTSLVCLREPRTGCWHPPFILSAFQTFPFHDYSTFPGQLHFSAVGMHALAPMLPDF